MAKQAQTFDPFAIVRKFAELDPTKIMGELTKAFSPYRAAGVDVGALLESQRKNIETLQAANERALAGVQAIAGRQREILEQTIAEASEALKTLSSSKGPQEAVAKQAELLQVAVEKATTNMRELAEMVTKANDEIVDTMNKRISESLEEIKSLAAKGA